MELTWDDLKARVDAERQPREQLERAAARAEGDSQLALRLARACVRDNKLVEALAHYDRAEFLGQSEATDERRLIARRVGDFPAKDFDSLT